jgi:hypothetical protein
MDDLEMKQISNSDIRALLLRIPLAWFKSSQIFFFSHYKTDEWNCCCPLIELVN